MNKPVTVAEWLLPDESKELLLFDGRGGGRHMKIYREGHTLRVLLFNSFGIYFEI